MAGISASTQWEVDVATGTDTNGGGFDSTMSGAVDYTYGANQRTIAFDGTIKAATTSGTSATITMSGSTPYVVLAGDAGNVVNITGGSGFTAGRYQILTPNPGAGTWVLDRNCCAGASSGMTGTAGGALASPGQAAAILATSNNGLAGQIVNIKSGTYSIGGGTQNTAGNKVNTSLATHAWIGYGTTHQDGLTKPVFQANANTMTLWAGGNFDITIENVEFQKGSSTAITGVSLGGRGICRSCKATSLDGGGLTSGQSCLFDNCEASGTGGATSAAIFSTGGGSKYIACYAHGGTIAGFSGSAGDTFEECISYNNAASGFNVASASAVVFKSCLSYGNTGSGISGFSFGSSPTAICYSCVSVNNGTSGSCYGFSKGAGSFCRLYNCAAYGNHTADTNGTFLVNSGFQSLGGDPTVSGATNFGLNQTTGAGATCRGAGFSQSWPGLSGTTGYPDIGPVQASYATPIPPTGVSYRPKPSHIGI